MNTAQLLPKTFELRDYQKIALAQVYHFFNLGIRSVLAYAPTGAGKTALASQIIADYVNQNKRVLFLVHRTKLVTQTQQTLLKHFGITASIIWGDRGKPDYSLLVQIAMLQSLQNRKLPPDIDLVILDEAHTASYYKVYERIVTEYSNGIMAIGKAQFLGLTATPWRAKAGEGYCHLFQALVRCPYPQQLIDMGYLSRARQFVYKGLIDESKLRVADGEFTRESLDAVCTSELNSEIVRRYIQRDPDFARKALAFCANVRQALDLTARFLYAGATSECITGGTPLFERDRIFGDFASGKIRVLVSVAVLTEGFDEPSADCVLLCRPVKSRALFIQACGRGLRIFPGKEDCWVIDFCENIKRMGFPTGQYDINLCPQPPETLDDPPTKQCPECESEIYAFLMVCPHCGHVFRPKNFEKVPREGKLEEYLTPEQRKHIAFLKSMVVDLYNKEAPNSYVDFTFEKKWGYKPPEDWYDGVLFGERWCWEADVQIYWRYLLAVFSNSSPQTREWQMKCIIREFKSAIAWAEQNFRSTHDEAVVQAKIAELLSYQPWWKILSCSQDAPLPEIYLVYQDKINQCNRELARSAKILEARTKIFNLALEQACQRHELSPKVISITFEAVRKALARQDFASAANAVDSVTLVAKEIIWNKLEVGERFLFRRYLSGLSTSTAIPVAH